MSIALKLYLSGLMLGPLLVGIKLLLPLRKESHGRGVSVYYKSDTYFPPPRIHMDKKNELK